MSNNINNILKGDLGVRELAYLLQLKGADQKLLFSKAQEVQLANVGRKVFYRGLVEFSNVCAKDCFYCGIRKGNKEIDRYNIEDEHIVNAAKFAWENKYSSMVLQAGERNDSAFIDRVTKLLKTIKQETNNELGITISLGEQTADTYKKWFDSGAHRYLLRIETSSPVLYKQLHPDNQMHDYTERVSCLDSLRNVGYQVGTGVMIGLPWQTYEDLARDLLFMKERDIDMCGMGPYIEHEDTPLYAQKEMLWPIEERFNTSLNMIALLRILMKDINIAATTALQAIDPMGREKALKIGANVIMPNITPTAHRKDYQLYQNKPCTDEGAEDCGNCMSIRIEMADREPGLGEWGDSPHFQNRTTPLK